MARWTLQGDSDVSLVGSRVVSSLQCETLSIVQNKTPLRLSRECLLCIFCVYAFLTGPFYFNWAPVSYVFLAAGFFRGACDSGELDYSKPADEPKCQDEEIAVHEFFIISMMCDMCFSLLAGLLLDSVGPKVTAVIGSTTLAVSWFLSGASKHLQKSGAATIVMSASLSAAFLPCLSIANLFPNARNSVIGLLTFFRYLSGTVPLVLKTVFFESDSVEDTRSVAYTYGTLCIGSCVFMAACFFPYQKWQRVRALEYPRDIETPGAAEDLPPSGIPTETPDARNSSDTEVTTRRRGSIVKWCHNSIRRCLSAPSHSVDSLDAANLRCDILQTIERGTTEARLLSWNDWRAFFLDASSSVFIFLCLFEALLLISESFFKAAGRRIIPQAYETSEAINILAAFPVPLIGFLADKRGIIASMCIVNVFVLLAFIVSIIPQFPAISVCQYLASITMAVAAPFFVTQIYCYILQSFQEAHMGKLIGLASFIAGLPMVAAIFMVRAGFQKGFFDMVIICISLLGASLFLLGVIVILRMRRAAKVLAKLRQERSLQELPPI
ncbi:potential mitochondrial membrane protein,related [Neospora caninum Liverpool]|uniref:Potential mitochondrial membrane protein,related n=1 Tax=Neospora caninum (strain Liverpool) TaxID=572307 RepID=F0V749_NEOCL|nr:potential mitochondrial membrane protein,related [Neospora caninum Liverpool]CBZ49540.1 potential mitochondrial membrane protein,related [Neospora caninum Liverpool]CEL64119.1 TPA: Potential mitochondrial membrane protein,related [Neospora caninum Liverpool]|eukprot:XP_003879575.1 potential mitochondrial membrane protein,related [Neospora caninum Liverpool]